MELTQIAFEVNGRYWAYPAAFPEPTLAALITHDLTLSTPEPAEIGGTDQTPTAPLCIWSVRSCCG